MEGFILFLFYATILFAFAIVGCVVSEFGDWISARKHQEYIKRLNKGWK